MVVVDPPFITEGVWENYSKTTKLLLKKGYSSDGTPIGKVILTTLAENADMLKCLLGAEPTVNIIAALEILVTFLKNVFYTGNCLSIITVTFFQPLTFISCLLLQLFQPSIPNLVYQYSLYTNYETEVFNVKNPEIP